MRLAKRNRKRRHKGFSGSSGKNDNTNINKTEVLNSNSTSYRNSNYKKRKDLRIAAADFAKASVDAGSSLSLSSSSNVRIGMTTRAQIENYFADTLANAGNIAALMENLYKTNGSVQKIIDYYTSILTYNYNIYPDLNEKDGLDIGAIDLEEYLSVASAVDKYQVELYAPYFVRSALINGVAFFYEISSASGVAYLEFPISLCRVVMIEDGVYRWGIDVSGIRAEDVEEIKDFPTEIKNAIETGPQEESNKWSGDYYIVGNKGFAITFDMSVIKNGGLAISPFASTILDSLEVDKAKSNVDIKDDMDAVRIVHGKIQTDNQGTPMIAPEEASDWMRILRGALPRGVATAVTPFDIENISLTGAGNQSAYNTVKDSQEQLFKSAGVPSAMFGSETTSSVIVNISIQKDANWAFEHIVPALNSYYNSVVGKVKTNSGIKWKLKVFQHSNFNKDEDLKHLKDAISFGGSRTDYMAALGMSPLEIYSKLALEQRVLDIDSIMLPKPTSHTLSGSNPTSEEVGRPKTDNPTDDTARINDSK